jgi:undecaprenyl-diphosphatase
MNPLQGVDYGAYYFFRNQRAADPMHLEPVMRFVNQLGGYVVLGVVALACLVLLLARRRLRTAGIFLSTLGAGVLLGEGLKLLVFRPRPPDAEIWLGPQAASPGFPSTSALASCFLLFWVARILTAPGFAGPSAVRQRLIQVFCGFLVLLIGFSQFYLGMHFLTDVLCGWTSGLLVALAGDYLDGLRKSC